jgi:hypothetical protein
MRFVFLRSELRLPLLPDDASRRHRCGSARGSRHQSPQRTSTSWSLPGSLSLTGLNQTVPCPAHRNERPDRIPIRPFVAEFTAKYAGFTCQEVAHDYTKAFDAAVKTAVDFGWDAVVPNMVYVWTGLAQALGLRYYGIPGIHIPHTTGFNYLEPPEDGAFMREDEYDELIRDPTAFLYNVWLPRVSTEVSRLGEASTYRNNLAFVKGGMAMLQYFYAFGPQIERLKAAGIASAIAGIFKAPFDILADKLRGYIGLTMDMATQRPVALAPRSWPPANSPRSGPGRRSPPLRGPDRTSC